MKSLTKKELTFGHRCGTVVVKVVEKSAEAPTPALTLPVKTTNAKVFGYLTVNSTPEEDTLAFPFLRNEMLIFSLK